jgi:hypothetical protein
MRNECQQEGTGLLRIKRYSRSGPGDDTDLSLGENVSGHDSHLTLLRDHTGTVSTDHPGLALTPQSVVDHQLVSLGDTLSDGHDQGDLGFDGFEDGTGSEGRRDVDDGSVGVLVLLGFLDAGVNGETEVGLAGFLRE